MNALAEVLNFVLDNLQMCLSNSLKSTLRNLPSAGDVPQSTLPNPPHTGVEINESSVNTFSKGNNIKVSWWYFTSGRDGHWIIIPAGPAYLNVIAVGAHKKHVSISRQNTKEDQLTNSFYLPDIDWFIMTCSQYPSTWLLSKIALFRWSPF